MGEKDRKRWDEWYAGEDFIMGHEPPGLVLECDACFPDRGRALDVACGEGQLATWLARKGLSVVGVDISPPALAKAARLAEEAGITDRVRLVEWDLESGLPALDGPFDVITCLRYYQPALMPTLRSLLAPGGLLLLEVRLVTPERDSPFRARPGEALEFAGDLHVHLYREGVIDGRDGAQLLAQKVPVRRMRFG